jgi:hypothetical protein
MWLRADVTDSHMCTCALLCDRRTDSSAPAVTDTRCTWHAPRGVQKLCLTGEHLFTYTVFYDLTRASRKNPGLQSEPQTYAKL